MTQLSNIQMARPGFANRKADAHPGKYHPAAAKSIVTSRPRL